MTYNNYIFLLRTGLSLGAVNFFTAPKPYPNELCKRSSEDTLASIDMKKAKMNNGPKVKPHRSRTTTRVSSSFHAIYIWPTRQTSASAFGATHIFHYYDII
jgi:hypothetical protein